MTGDGRWRTDRSGIGERSHHLWRVVNGVVEYHRTPPCNYAPLGRIIKYSYTGALNKVRELNAGALAFGSGGRAWPDAPDDEID